MRRHAGGSEPRPREAGNQMVCNDSGGAGGKIQGSQERENL